MILLKFFGNGKIELNHNSIRNYMADMLIMSAAPAAVSVYYYGWRAVILIAISAITAVVCEYLACAITKKENTVSDLSALFTGVIIALMLPVSVPLWMPVVGSAFAILVAKLPFGSTAKTPFVPAAAGLAFLIICWPSAMFKFPAPGAEVLAASDPLFSAETSLAGMLKTGNSLSPDWFNYFDVFVGMIPGAMGTTSMLVCVALAIYLFIRYPDRWISSAGFVAVCAFCAVVFPRVMSGRKMSLVMEIASGMLLFCAIFLITDPATQPASLISKLLYGMSAGALCMLIRYVGPYEDGSVFAVLLINAVWPVLDPYIEKYLVPSGKHKKDKPDKDDKDKKKKKEKKEKAEKKEKKPFLKKKKEAEVNG